MQETIINAIDDWMHVDQSNYITYFVVIAILLISGLVVSSIFYRKLGKSDERTVLIKLRINQLILGAGFISALFFITSLNQDVEYISQLGMIPLTLTALASAVITGVYYYRNK